MKPVNLLQLRRSYRIITNNPSENGQTPREWLANYYIKHTLGEYYIHKQRKYHYTRRANAHKGNADLSPEEWQSIKRQQKGKCAGCGETKKLTLDHVLAVKKGGTHTMSNAQGLCRSCNSSKGTRDFHEWLEEQRQKQCA